jgi:hypothetical protein
MLPTSFDPGWQAGRVAAIAAAKVDLQNVRLLMTIP